MEQTLNRPHLDRRTARTRKALREALATEIQATGDLAKVTVTAVADRAGITRRTFYSHYRDIPSLVRDVEEEGLIELAKLAYAVTRVTLSELEGYINRFEACPGTVELLRYFQEDGAHLVPLLGEGGDPAFVERIKEMVRKVVLERALHGFISPALHIFDYYLTFVISAEVGVLMRWLATGMSEPPEVMARMMTALVFVRPGDLYGRPIDIDVSSLATQALSFMKEFEDVR